LPPLIKRKMAVILVLWRFWGLGDHVTWRSQEETRTGLDVSDLILIFEKAHGEELSEGRLLLG